LVIGAEKMSSIADWDDRATCVLFGDGAGACVLKASDDEVGLMGSVMGSDGSLWELLHIPAGGSRMPTTAETVDQRLHCLRMQGREVYKNAVTRMTEAAFAVLDKTGLTVHDVACIIPHQANIRIIRAVGQRLGLPEERFFVNLDKYGNTSAASSAIALDEAVRQGSIKKGDLVLIFVFGGGFTWGASVLRWLK
jgi:3-oxoacyl-[acyl-carrier-protein] synthase-3